MNGQQRIPGGAAPAAPDVDVVVVGAGFAGLYMLYRLRGLGLRARAFEQASGVGGTWWWNRYPGARCDVESMQYSYGFSDELQQEWKWSERFASQPEILRYANHVADRLDLRRDISFSTRVQQASWDETTDLWTVRTDKGDVVRARHVVMATGCLSTARLPEIEGIDSFGGKTFHTGQWPHEKVDFTGQRVGVIGTGSSAIQAIPVIAEQAGHLTVFQRTANFSIPSHNAPMDEPYEQEWKSDYPARRAKARAQHTGILRNLNDKGALEVSEEERRAEYERRWAVGGTAFMVSFNDLVTNEEANRTAAEFVRSKIREIVKDARTAELLAPKDHPIGTKRICADTGYYETFNRSNVSLVDLRSNPIARIVPEGVQLADGTVHEFDAIVFATGFDAMTGTLTSMDIRGVGGETLAEKWAAGPRTYLGLCSAGFPNLFMVTGPGSPSVLSNMIVSIEQHVDWITQCLAEMQKKSLTRIEAEREAEDKWVEHNNEVAHRTLYPRAGSWYMGANVKGKPRVFMPYIGGVGTYRKICEEVAAESYRGFRLGEPVAA
ncbi:NAD(P)/FAD-dependent oxidoreductase [Siccirubricoccus sp. KC 17139]|uniref:NAD(P)/FAD-dependent oxidoreductase n=2 Tax=Siccirubricoccus soli TaxID=2899147 RepID=A0ABT1DD53_9PROT|nr:NAD(P)/FAD-dependent oxidoreductase [Siccirubricoccus soli]MCP2686001.1 NAD(P)/FAD-dependent oxidoreductase [Siccirubricoccus soli]